MYKNKHFILRVHGERFIQRFDADMSIRDKYTNLQIWVNYHPKEKRGQIQMIFCRNCKNEAEAIEIMDGFNYGHRSDWEEV